MNDIAVFIKRRATPVTKAMMTGLHEIKLMEEQITRHSAACGTTIMRSINFSSHYNYLQG